MTTQVDNNGVIRRLKKIEEEDVLINKVIEIDNLLLDSESRMSILFIVFINFCRLWLIVIGSCNMIASLNCSQESAMYRRDTSIHDIDIFIYFYLYLHTYYLLMCSSSFSCFSTPLMHVFVFFFSCPSLVWLD